MGVLNAGGNEKIVIFDQYFALSLKLYQIEPSLLSNAYRNSCGICQMVLFPMSRSDATPVFQVMIFIQCHITLFTVHDKVRAIDGCGSVVHRLSLTQ